MKFHPVRLPRLNENHLHSSHLKRSPHPFFTTLLLSTISCIGALHTKAQQPEQPTPQATNTPPSPEIGFLKRSLPNHLFAFRYEPSQRDPFISCLIITPTVTKDLPEEALPPSIDLAKGKQTILNIIAKRLKITGLTSGKVGRNFAITESGNILSSGKYLALKADDKSGIIDMAIQHSLQLKTNQSGDILIKVIDIQNRELILLKPWEKDQAPLPETALMRIPIKSEDHTSSPEQTAEATPEGAN